MQGTCNGSRWTCVTSCELMHPTSVFLCRRQCPVQLSFENYLLTMLINSLSFSSPACLSLSLASASLPFRMGSSNRFLNSWAVPVLGGQGQDKTMGQNKQDSGKRTNPPACISTKHALPLTKDSSIDKVHQTEVFKQVILDRGARYKHPTLGVHSI